MLVICIQNHVLCLLWLNGSKCLKDLCCMKWAKMLIFIWVDLFSIITVRTVIDIGILFQEEAPYFSIYIPGTLLVNKACRVYRNCCLSISLQTWFCTIQFTADMILFNSCTVLAYVAFGPNWQGLLGLNEHNIKVSSLIGRPRTGHAQVNLCFRISLYTTKTQTPTDLTFYLMTE